MWLTSRSSLRVFSSFRPSRAAGLHGMATGKGAGRYSVEKSVTNAKATHSLAAAVCSVLGELTGSLAHVSSPWTAALAASAVPRRRPGAESAARWLAFGYVATQSLRDRYSAEAPCLSQRPTCVWVE